MSPDIDPLEGLAGIPTNTSCDFKKETKWKVEGVKRTEIKWDLTKVTDLRFVNTSNKKNEPRKIRCPYCFGPIKLHFKGKGKKVVVDHFEHLGEKVGTSDRYTCRVGEGFEGNDHKMSIQRID